MSVLRCRHGGLAASRDGAARRMSRGAWLSLRTTSMVAVAATAIVVVACSARDEVGEPKPDASTTTAADASVIGRGAPPPPPILEFACGPSRTCLGSSGECCVHSIDSNSVYPCWGQPPAQPVITETYECSGFAFGSLKDQDRVAALKAACPQGLTCACEQDAGSTPDPSSGVFECADGGVGWVLRRYTEESGCGGCYGSPPAPLGRHVA